MQRLRKDKWGRLPNPARAVLGLYKRVHMEATTGELQSSSQRVCGPRLAKNGLKQGSGKERLATCRPKREAGPAGAWYTQSQRPRPSVHGWEERAFLSYSWMGSQER